MISAKTRERLIRYYMWSRVVFINFTDIYHKVLDVSETKPSETLIIGRKNKLNSEIYAYLRVSLSIMSMNTYCLFTLTRANFMS